MQDFFFAEQADSLFEFIEFGRDEGAENVLPITGMVWD